VREVRGERRSQTYCTLLAHPSLESRNVASAALKYSLCTNTSVNPLTPNDPYGGRTAPLTSKRCILYIYPTNIGTEYFKHGIYSQFFSLQNAVCFIILIYLVPVLFTFYIQGVLKLKKNNSGAKRLIYVSTTILLYKATRFDPFKRSSSGFISYRLNRCCVHVWIPTCTQHLLTRSDRRPDDDRLEGSKHVALYNKMVVLTYTH